MSDDLKIPNISAFLDEEANLKRLRATCRKFLDDNRVSRVEATVNDRVYENAPALVEEIGKILGFWKDPEAEDDDA